MNNKIKNFNGEYTEILGKEIYERRNTLILKCSCNELYLQREEYFDDDTKNKFKMCPTCSVITNSKIKRNKGGVDIIMPLYKQFHSMKARCYNEKNPAYKTYGAIGITVCEEWLKDYRKFQYWALENGWKENIAGQVIDKDILCEQKGISPKIYSPETCLIIDNSENTRFMAIKKDKTYSDAIISKETIGRGDLNMIDSQYIALMRYVLRTGEKVKGRNGNMIISNFFNFTIRPEANTIPIVSYRKIYYKAAIGELAALLKGVTNESDFKKYGVNYWHKWSGENGELNLDYSNQLMQNGQLQYVIDNLKKDKQNGETGRKHLVSLWNHDNVKSGELSLECCWESFIFTLVNGKLNMTFRMRSLDIFYGLPYDILIAWTMLRIVATELDVKMGVIDFAITNPHIYEEFIDDCKKLAKTKACVRSARYKYTGTTVKNFEPEQLEIRDYLYNEFDFDTEVKL